MSKNKQSLQSITKSSIELEKQIIESEGILTPELEKSLEISAENMASKVDSYVYVIERMKAGIEHHTLQMKAHADIIKRLEAQIDWLQSSLDHAIVNLKRETLNGNEYIVYKKLNPPSVEVYNEDEIPDSFKKEKVTIVLDKKEVGNSLKLGFAIPGARLVQKSRIDYKTRSEALEG